MYLLAPSSPMSMSIKNEFKSASSILSKITLFLSKTFGIPLTTSLQIHFPNQFHNFFNQHLQVLPFNHRCYIFFILKTLPENIYNYLFILKFLFRQLFYLFLYFNRCICNLIASSIRVAFLMQPVDKLPVS